MRVLDLPRCPACGTGRFDHFELDPGAPLRRCQTCATVSAPTYAHPDEIYGDGYMFGGRGSFGTDVRHPSVQAYLARVADRRVRMVERATGTRAGSLLDVGCGTGEVLAAARDRGWRTHGVEPERTGAGMARDRGLDVTVARLEESGLPERSYDVVSAFHVLEHLPDSRGFLRGLIRHARPGGAVVVEVPNWRGVPRRRLGGSWRDLRPGEHLAYFTPRTLAAVMRASGIVPVAVRTPAYVGPPQTLDHALADLVRHGRYRRLLEPLSRVRAVDGAQVRFPTRLGWAVLHATEAVYDRAGVGTVVFCVGTVA
jgi:2-polyprenyl-3-methyl-5-hydroxy-6-metoxy-1,4-benzoquinol methylase